MNRRPFSALVLGGGLLSLALLGASPPEKAGSPWKILRELLLVPGVSGHEAKVADLIQSRLPRGINPQRDEMENLWFTIGDNGPHLVFVAHTDELGFVVKEITSRGTLKVSRRGGFLPGMYEGWPVVVYTRKGEVNGVVVPRSGYLKRRLEPSTYSTADVEVYLGVSAAEAARNLGVAEGDPITIRKRVVELTPDLLAARAVDDRAGCAALLAAAHRVEWNAIQGKTVTFAWDVQEETGLHGASALARRLGADFVFPVDTFVSSSAPLDEKRFADLPLGGGAVLRAVDSSSVTPRSLFLKVMDIARARGIPVMAGNTRGGNDGSVFVPQGAADIPLSWPGNYSHSFIEKIHRHDLEALTDLITALVEDW